MPVTPSGPLSLALSGARTLVAHCASFIDRTGAADAAAAKLQVFYDDRPNDALDSEGNEAVEPITTWATVFEFTGATEYEVERLKAENGSTMVALFSARPDDYSSSRTDALMDFRNWCGAILVEMLALAKTPIDGGNSWHLAVRKIRQIAPANWCDPIDEDETAPFMMATFLLEWV